MFQVWVKLTKGEILTVGVLSAHGEKMVFGADNSSANSIPQITYHIHRFGSKCTFGTLRNITEIVILVTKN